MLKKVHAQTWKCSRCLLRQQGWRRGLWGAATQPQEDLARATHSAPGAQSDDATLGKIFDSKAFWREFSQRSSSLGKRGGLLQNRYLTSPEGFGQFADDTLQKCKRLVAKILAAKTVEEYRNMARDMDRLSDLLCRVIDLVDFIRSVHPDTRIQRAASQAHYMMFEYMNVLNTSTSLKDKLEQAMAMPEVYNFWSAQEQKVARILHEDFAQSAQQGSDATRRKFVEVSSEISQLGAQIMDRMTPARPYIRVPSTRLGGMDPIAVKKLNRGGQCFIPTHGSAATLALRTADDPAVRREVFLATRTASADSIERVEELIKKRAELAHLAGFESYAHMALKDKMAKSPEAVDQFLEALAMDNNHQVREDLAQLQAIKGHTPLDPWDREYYTTKLRSRYATQPRDTLSSYFSLGNVMQGLSRLFDRLYGIRLVPHETVPGETWNDDVRRLDVIDESEGLIAVMYCDLFARPNKSPNPAHFTLRCSREISRDEMDEAAHFLPPDATAADLTEFVNDGMATSIDANTQKMHQLPTIALICDFPTSNSTARDLFSTATPTLLSYSQLSTLFHEMGHALHSILGRTSLQNVAGTRCATDFAELPSILMEHFASSPAVLSLYARHWQTGKPLDTSLVTTKLAIDRRVTDAADTEAQIQLAVLDQRFHAQPYDTFSNTSSKWSSTDEYHATWTDPRFASLPEPRGTAWHGFFGHLFGYGAVYYAYLFDRAIAKRVFQQVFGYEPTAALNRDAGQTYRDEVLRWGGARDGWACVAGVLGTSHAWMADGGSEAMREVGRWGAVSAATK